MHLSRDSPPPLL